LRHEQKKQRPQSSKKAEATRVSENGKLKIARSFEKTSLKIFFFKNTSFHNHNFIVTIQLPKKA
jgi:hypothetical protein